MERGHLQNDEDIEHILRIAVRLPNPNAELGLRDRLQAAADELGVTPEQLAVAEKKWAQERSNMADMDAYFQEQKNGFYAHLIPYVIVNSIIIVSGLRDGEMNFPYVALFWGIGLAFHAWGVYDRKSENFKREFEKWRRKKNRRKDEDDDDDD